METRKTIIQGHGDKPMVGADGKPLQCLLWGNNAAWICQCGELLGNRTAESKKQKVKAVCCPNDQCRLTYGIVPGLNDSGNYQLGPAESVHLIVDK